jgi:hypothetical protein
MESNHRPQLCTTNPTFGRGLTLATWGAADLVDVIATHTGDPPEQALALDARIGEHVGPDYQEQAAVDSARLLMLRHAILGEPLPPRSATNPDRITFTQLRAAASFDPIAFRAFWKLMFMLCHPDEIYLDQQIVACTHEALTSHGMDVLQPRGHFDPQVASPSHTELLAALGARSDPIRPAYRWCLI